MLPSTFSLVTGTGAITHAELSTGISSHLELLLIGLSAIEIAEFDREYSALLTAGNADATLLVPIVEGLRKTASERLIADVNDAIANEVNTLIGTLRNSGESSYDYTVRVVSELEILMSSLTNLMSHVHTKSTVNDVAANAITELTHLRNASAEHSKNAATMALQLAERDQRIAELEAQLLAKDAEIASLKPTYKPVNLNFPTAAATLDLSKATGSIPPELTRLHGVIITKDNINADFQTALRSCGWIAFIGNNYVDFGRVSVPKLHNAIAGVSGLDRAVIDTVRTCLVSGSI